MSSSKTAENLAGFSLKWSCNACPRCRCGKEVGRDEGTTHHSEKRKRSTLASSRVFAWTHVCVCVCVCECMGCSRLRPCFRCFAVGFSFLPNSVHDCFLALCALLAVCLLLTMISRQSVSLTLFCFLLHAVTFGNGHAQLFGLPDHFTPIPRSLS